MNRARIAAFALLLTTPSLAQSPGITPEQLGEIFCLARVADDMGPIDGLLTPELRTAIAEAEAANAVAAAEAPDDKPPLGDGIPWSSWPDYAPICTPRAAELMMDEARIPIGDGFPDSPHADYVDYLWLRLVDGPLTNRRVWRIDNLAYGTDGDLKSALASAFMP